MPFFVRRRNTRWSAQKGDAPRRIGRTKGGLNAKLHAVCDDVGRPVILILTEGQMSDHTGRRSDLAYAARRRNAHRGQGL